MDFGTLLHKAQKNEVTKKEPIRYYSTKFEPPKKEQRNKNQLAVNVKKFLEKKEQEEKQKRLEAQKKKEELLALRAKDKKAVKRVNVMLKRTKSANQSVIEDAVDTDNTAVTINGPAQPDEDDYGYVSQEASAYYNKMMEKYNKMPEEPSKFSMDKKKQVSTNLTSTKDRVKAALEREKEEALMPHKRKRKHKNQEDGGSGLGSDEKHEVIEEKPEEKKMKLEKPKPKGPPPMNFADLLKLAEKKQFEPIVIEKKPKDDENPLTKKQKKEMERYREWQERKIDKNNLKPPAHDSKTPISDKDKSKNNKLPKSENSSKLAEALTKDRKMKDQTNINSTTSKKSEKVPDKPEEVKRPKIDWGPKHPGASKMNLSNNGSTHSSFKASSNVKSQNLSNPKLETVQQSSSSQKLQSAISSKSQQHNSQILLPNSSRNSNSKDVKVISKDVKRQSKENNYHQNDRKIASSTMSKEPIKRDLMKPKQFPPSDLMPRQFPPADVRRKPASNSSKMKVNKRRIMDDDDEEDSEMDDFIDDGPEEEEDYSKYISEIFGYNKSKYASYDDDDDDIMESSFAQQMKEEVISTKMGIMEDLEDMKLEEEHKRRKALMKKKLAKRK
ncbi:hypothetical protein HHI36_010603 [Cryptolaemus montrouzieri]|uniref:Protein SPT2 homolog n=1 Tax=Cryptolaemus montrouzieri TaxID=559131 RepID=A0ABD2MJB7_9CUCU